MDPLILVTILMVTVLVIGGVWGSVVISALMKRKHLKLQSPGPDPRIDELQADYRQLEGRLDNLEEELGFFRELHKPEASAQLPSPEDVTQ